MATITNAKLTVTHDHEKKLVHPVVTADVNFTALELCQMRNCKGVRLFKLKCQLWGSDDPDPDDFLFTYSTVFYFPDTTPTATENRKFDVGVLGEGVLDEDSFPRPQDEVYGLLRLTNLASSVELRVRTNEVHHYF